jgi:hypothetical protein
MNDDDFTRAGRAAGGRLAKATSVATEFNVRAVPAFAAAVLSFEVSLPVPPASTARSHAMTVVMDSLNGRRE